MKTIIYSCHTNCKFIELQYKSIQTYFKTDYEYIVFDDSRDHEHLTAYNKIQTNDIKNICNKLNINYIRIPQDLHKNRDIVIPGHFFKEDDHPVSRCALAVQYGMNYLIKNYSDCYIFLIDSDMFFIEKFIINNFIKEYDLIGISQGRKDIVYLWNGIFIANLNKVNLLEFNWDAGSVYKLDNNNKKIETKIDVDVGGHNYYYLKTNGYLDDNSNNIHFYGPMHISDIDCIWMKGENNINFISDNLKKLFIKFSTMKSKPKDSYVGWINKELFLNNTILHIRGGGGWCYHKEEYHDECVNIINEYINKVIL
jgi:hypothetical protein